MLKVTTLLILLIVVMYPLYLWVTYIDVSYKTGSAYGLTIGDSKQKVYNNLSIPFKNITKPRDKIFIQIKSTKEMAVELATDANFDVMIEPLFHEAGFESFKLDDNWEFYINGSFFNVLRLKFCDEKLCEIYRHRKYFEFT